jgi:hypothetical protein
VLHAGGGANAERGKRRSRATRKARRHRGQNGEAKYEPAWITRVEGHCGLCSNAFTRAVQGKHCQPLRAWSRRNHESLLGSDNTKTQCKHRAMEEIVFKSLDNRIALGSNVAVVSPGADKLSAPRISRLKCMVI